VLYEISIKDLLPQATACVRVCIQPEKISSVLGEILPQISNYLESFGISPSGPAFSRYFEMKADLVDLEAGLPVPAAITAKGQILSGELPGGRAAVTWHMGSYAGISQAYEALQVWIEDQGHEPAGPPWEVYWTNPGEVPNPADWKTEVIYPIRSMYWREI
jgi:effector-binding domain-containing protein